MVSSRFAYEIKLNSEPLQATLGATVIRKLQEPLDEGGLHIPITVFNYEYEMLGNLYIKITDVLTTQSKEFTYLISQDKVKVQSVEGLYSHDLKVIEYSYALETRLVKALTFTKRKVNNRKAPFRVNHIQSGPLYFTANTTAWIPPLEFNQDYEKGVSITIPQCIQGYDNFSSTVRRDVFIRVYKPNKVTYNDNGYYMPTASYDTEVILSQNSATLTFDKEGIWLIEYGIVNFNLDGPEPTARKVFLSYFLNVLDIPEYSLYDYIQRIRSVIPLETKQYHEETRLFDLDSNLVERFKKIEMPQMYFTQMTLRQTLNVLFKYINSISRLQYVNDNLDKLTIDEFNKVVGSFNMGNMTDFETSQDLQGYATRMVSWLENSLQENFRNNPSVKTPATNYFKTVRAKAIQLVNAQNGFILPLEGGSLYELSRLQVNVPKIEYGYFNATVPAQTVVVQPFTLDLTTRILEKSEWDLKQNTNNFPSYNELGMWSELVGMRPNKGGNIYWERGKEYLDFSMEQGSWFSETIITSTLKEALAEYFTINSPLQLDKDGYMWNTVGFNPIDIEDFTNLFRNISFNVEYITLKQTSVKTNRADTEIINKESEIRLNQNQRIVNFGLASKNAYGNIQRSGMPYLNFSKTHTRLDTMLEIGMKDSNGYVITQVGYELYNDHIIGHYEATKNHNRLSEFMGIDQAYRVFEVPKNNEVYERHENYEDFMIIDRPTANNFEEENTLYNGAFIDRAFKNLYANDVLEDKISFAFVRTDGFLKLYPDLSSEFKAIMTPVSSFGGDQVLVFNFGFKHNLIAGNAIYRKGVNYFNNPIFYTDRLGRFDELWFGLASLYTETTPFENIASSEETVFNKTYAYPLIKSDTSGLKQNFLVKTGNINDSSYNPIIYMKDISESMASFNYQVSIMPYDYRDYVLGSKFFTANRLVFNVSNIEKLYLYRYRDNTKYDIFDNLMIKDDTFTHIYDKVELIRTSGYTNLNFNLSTKQLTFINEAVIDPNIHTSWAIADEDGNLIIACNVNVNGFIVKRRHFRPNIKRIGEYGTNIKMGISIVVSSNMTASGSVPTFYFGTANLPIVSSMSGSGTPSTDYVGIASLDVKSSYSTTNELSTDYTGFATLPIESQMSSGGVVDINFNATASLNIVASITPVGVVSTNYYGGVSLSVVSSMSTTVGTAQYFQWVAGGSAQTPSIECNSLDDVGNVRAVLSGCSFNTINSYSSTTNETTAFTCGVNTTRIVCTFNKTLGLYVCEEQDVTENYTYETCTLV